MKMYVEFIYPGIIVSETSLVEISVDQYLHPELVTLPENAFGFRFGIRNEIKSGSEILKGEFHAKSGWYFKGIKMNKEQVAIKDGINSILYRNMINNNYDFVVRTKFGQAIPLQKEDVILR